MSKQNQTDYISRLEGKKFRNGDTLQQPVVSCIKVLMAGQFEWVGGSSPLVSRSSDRNQPFVPFVWFFVRSISKHQFVESIYSRAKTPVIRMGKQSVLLIVGFVMWVFENILDPDFWCEIKSGFSMRIYAGSPVFVVRMRWITWNLLQDWCKPCQTIFCLFYAFTFNTNEAFQTDLWKTKHSCLCYDELLFCIVDRSINIEMVKYQALHIKTTLWIFKSHFGTWQRQMTKSMMIYWWNCVFLSCHWVMTL